MWLFGLAACVVVRDAAEQSTAVGAWASCILAINSKQSCAASATVSAEQLAAASILSYLQLYRDNDMLSAEQLAAGVLVCDAAGACASVLFYLHFICVEPV
jgi:hypothetical protein